MGIHVSGSPFNSVRDGGRSEQTAVPLGDKGIAGFAPTGCKRREYLHRGRREDTPGNMAGIQAQGKGN